MLLSLFLLFLKLGFVSVGGGYAMMALILQEGEAAVGLTAAEFADMAALELLASGPIALNAATYVGYVKGGILGSVVATLAVCVSPFVLTSIVSFFLKRFSENRYVLAFIDTIKVACGGLLLGTVVTLGREILLGGATMAQLLASPWAVVNWVGLAIAAACLLLMLKWKVSPILMILLSAVAGVFLL